MGMKVLQRAMDPGQAIFYDQSFRIVLETHMAYLRNSPNTVKITVNHKDAFHYYGQLYLYLSQKSIDPDLYWLVMRLSGMLSPDEFNADIKQLYIPDRGFLDTLRMQHKMTGIIDL